MHSLELKYSTLPVITELDKMDEDQPSKLDIMDQSSTNLDMVIEWVGDPTRVMVACWMVPTKNRRDRQEDKEGEWPLQSRSEQVQLVT